MGVPDSSLLDLVDKVRSWASWGRSATSLANFGSVFDMAESCCCVCELKFTELCHRYCCQGCRRCFCVACVRGSGSGSIIVVAASNLRKNDRFDREIKSCKFCNKTSKRHIEKIYPSESPRASPERQSSPAPSEKTHLHEKEEVITSDYVSHAVEVQDLDLSPQKLSSSRLMSVGQISQNSLPFSLQSDEEPEESGRHFFSSSSDYYHDCSNIDLSSVSFRSESYSITSAGSSPLDSPSRFNINTPRCGHSVQTGKDGSPKLQNGCPSSPDMVAILKRPHRGTGDLENEDGRSDQLSVKQNEKLAEPLDFESNGHIWLPPPPEDDEAERNYFEYDDDDYDVVGDSRGVFSSSSSLTDLFPTKENQHEMQKEPLKAVIQGHFRALVSQLLQGEGINVASEKGSPDWLEIVSTLAWKAANTVKPDTSKGGSMDPGSYVKIKCVASGNPSESTLIKGVVCTKNIKHKRMTSEYKNPRLLILGGSLEYQRAQNQLASFNTLLEEEMNHLKMIVSKIEAHRPNVLLVEKSVSSYAQDYLLAKEISLVLNVKRPLLERIARCTGASIIPSVDSISLARLGHCELFRLEKVSEEHETANSSNKRPSKTLMYFEGCPRRLGCTILLKGLCREELKKVKHVVQYSVFAAYHLSLETSFLADEGAHLPKLAEKPSYDQQDNDTSDNATSVLTCSYGVAESLDSIDSLCPESLVNMVEGDREASELLPPASAVILDGSVDQMMSQNCQDFRDTDAAIGSDSAVSDSVSFGLTDYVGGGINPLPTELMEAVYPEEGQLKEMDTIDENEVCTDYLPTTDSQQSILVSFSSRCVSKGMLCERSRLLRIKFYGSFDKPLGRYLRDDLFDQAAICRSCKEPVEAHVQCYTHRQGVLTINVRRLDTPKLPGEKDGKIWMWHRCLRCAQIDNVPPATHRVIMSDAAWGLSFGKFLELSFSNHATANRLANCGHSLQRDCLRFYGFGSVVAFFHYSPIDILTVHLPRSMLEFNGHSKQEWMKREVEEIQSKTETLYAEVAEALEVMERKSTYMCSKSADSSDLHNHIQELRDLLDKERDECNALLEQAIGGNLQIVDTSIDILELNHLRRSLLIGSRAWDRRLYSLDSLISSESFTLEAADEKASCGELKALDSDSIKDPKIVGDLGEYGSEDTEARTSVCSMSHSCHLQAEDVYADGENPVSDNSSESLQSPLSNLSDKIDSAWTGTDVDACPEPLANQTNQVDKLPIKRLMAPARVYSFDSAMSLQEKIHKKRLPLSHLAAVRSFHGSGDYRSMVTDPAVSVMRTYSQVYSLEAQFTPSFISSVSHMAEGPRLLLPQTGQNSLVLAVYDNEPTSVIAYALSSKEYEHWVSDIWNRPDGSWCGKNINREDSMSSTFLSWQSFGSFELDYLNYGSYGSEDTSSRNNMPAIDLKRSPHLQISFGDDSSSSTAGKAKFLVTCYFAKQFEMLREKCCPSKVDFVRSLSRCRRWSAQGGKSNVYFAKSMDERFIIKQVTKIELESFQIFAAEYFKYLNESLDSGSPNCLAKVLGIFQVTVKHLKGGRETKMDLMVMENLFFNRRISRVYDLKGSSRSRYNADKAGANKVLLDMNLLETLRTSPIFLGSKAKRRLERAVWNDTSFLASVDVMDYSLLVGVDEERNELVLGIIDYMRQYTWDKHLETWVKASGILGGSKNSSPTIISPKQYKIRFRKAMTTYFLTVPDQWSS